MRNVAIDDYLIWYCDWCDSKHLVPWVLQHESRHFCPACARQSVLTGNNWANPDMLLE